MAVWSGAGVLLMTVYDGDLKAEEAFCRFLVCDPARIGNHAKKSPNIQDFTALVKRDPHFPFEWTDLGGAYAAKGKKAEAEVCFRNAVAMSPRWPPVMIRAVDFYFQTGNWKAALPLTMDVLDQVPDYDTHIFERYLKSVPLHDALDSGLPRGNPRPARSWLAYLVAYGTWPDIQRTWNWATNHGLINVATANSFVTWLLMKHPADAPNIWKEYLGPWSEDGYLKTNYVFNGGFEKGYTGCLMDWTFQPTEGVEIKIEENQPAEGKLCMRVRFDGEHNVGPTGLRQDVVLGPGKYHLKARIRTEGLTTDQGIQLRLSPEWGSEEFLGTRPWTAVDTPFTVTQLKVYHLELVRTPSFRFGNRIQGTLWLDDVRIEPAS